MWNIARIKYGMGHGDCTIAGGYLEFTAGAVECTVKQSIICNSQTYHFSSFIQHSSHHENEFLRFLPNPISHLDSNFSFRGQNSLTDLLSHDASKLDLGVCHADELFLLFNSGTEADERVADSLQDRSMSKRLVNTWVRVRLLCSDFWCCIMIMTPFRFSRPRL